MSSNPENCPYFCIMTFGEYKAFLYRSSDLYSDMQEMKVIYREFISHFCGIDPVHQLLIMDEEINEMIVPFLLDAAKRLSEGEPYQYIIGTAEFCNMKLWVNNSVFIPRPETEELTENVVSLADEYGTPSSVLDLATGSGCIALSLKAKFPMSKVYATDFSEEALAVASYNANIHHMSIELRRHHLMSEDFPYENTFDCIVSNPPYITSGERKLMNRRVLDYEPPAALFAPADDPLAFYRILKNIVVSNLSHGGFFVFEINEAKGGECIDLFRYDMHLFSNIMLKTDIYHKDRFILGVKK